MISSFDKKLKADYILEVGSEHAEKIPIAVAVSEGARADVKYILGGVKFERFSFDAADSSSKT